MSIDALHVELQQMRSDLQSGRPQSVLMRARSLVKQLNLKDDGSSSSEALELEQLSESIQEIMRQAKVDLAKMIDRCRENFCKLARIEDRIVELEDSLSPMMIPDRGKSIAKQLETIKEEDPDYSQEIDRLVKRLALIMEKAI